MKRTLTALTTAVVLGMGLVGCADDAPDDVCPTESATNTDPQTAALSAPELFGDKGGTTGGGSKKSGTSKNDSGQQKSDTTAGSSGNAAGGTGSTSKPSKKPKDKSKKRHKVDDDLFEGCDS